MAIVVHISDTYFSSDLESLALLAEKPAPGSVSQGKMEEEAQ